MLATYAIIPVPPGACGPRDMRRRLAEAMSRARVDASLAQAFLTAATEIVGNLLDHARPAPNTVTLTLGKDGHDWVLEATDDGPPFTSYATHAAEALAMVESGLRPRDGGLGLPLVLALFPDHQYRPGHGASGENRFRLRAPASGAGLADRQRILVVDDDPATRKLLSLYLSEDHDVTACAGIDEAWEHIRRHGVDLVISDIQMPGGDGMLLRRRLLEDASTQLVPFVFCTSHDEPEMWSRATELSIDDYLVKPVRKQTVLATVKRVLCRAADVARRLLSLRDEAMSDALRPTLPRRIGHYAVASRHRLAEAGGGDVLMHRAYEGGDIVVMADIMGHGEQGKLFAHALVGYLQGMLSGLAGKPSAHGLLDALAGEWRRDSVLARTLATAIVLNLGEDGELEIARAGHPLPLLLEDGTVRRWSRPHGPLLGLVEGIGYRSARYRLAPGARLALATDGLLEVDRACAHADHDAWLETALTATAGLSLDAAADHITTQFDDAVDHQARDDATLLLIEPL